MSVGIYRIVTSLAAGAAVSLQAIVGNFEEWSAPSNLIIIIASILASASVGMSWASPASETGSVTAKTATLEPQPSFFSRGISIGIFIYLFYQVVLIIQLWLANHLVAAVQDDVRGVLGAVFAQFLFSSTPIITGLFSFLVGATLCGAERKGIRVGIIASVTLLIAALVVQAIHIILGYTDHLQMMQGMSIQLILQDFLVAWGFIALPLFVGILVSKIYRRFA